MIKRLGEYPNNLVKRPAIYVCSRIAEKYKEITLPPYKLQLKSSGNKFSMYAGKGFGKKTRQEANS